MALSVVLSIASFIYFYGDWFDERMIPSFEELRNILDSPYAFHVGLFLLVLAGIVAVFVLMVVTAILDLRLGRKLRSGTAPSRRSILTVSVFNLLSGVLGGILLIPFGAAIGVYGLWFALSGRMNAPISGTS